MKSENKFTQKIIVIAVVAALCVVALCAVLIGVGGEKGGNLTEQLEMGARYLAELDYENAIAAYEAAIAIDPKNVEAYIGLADVYIAMGEPENAQEVLAEG